MKNKAAEYMYGCESWQPMGRVAKPEEIAKLLAFVVSDENAFMTGSEVTSDGGISLRPPKIE